MNVEKYREFLKYMIHAEDLKISVLDGIMHINEGTLRTNSIEININYNTISMYDLEWVREESKEFTNSSSSMLRAVLKNASPPKLEFYIPISQEDEFQQSTARLGYILPYSLVSYVDELIKRVHDIVDDFYIKGRD
ncbi:hypothetical protein [Salmonella enterica]|uniref:hypothetical protein n=1 Tax=Salmonella enterica TaxID=28901 RepID=UPI003A7F952C